MSDIPVNPAQPKPQSQPPSAVDEPPLITLLERGLKALKDWRNPEGSIQKWLKWVRRLLLGVNVAYAVILCLVLAGVEWRAEGHWFMSFALYIPPQVWLLPVIVLGPVTLLIRPRWCWLHIACIVLVLFVFMDPQFGGGSAASAKGKTIKVLTNNRGQDNKQSPTEFILAEKPDVVVFQEAGREVQFAKAYPELHVRAVNEFTFISRFPIKQVELLPPRGLNQRPVAARALLDWEGQDLAVYTIHLTSPREFLEPMSKGGFLAAIFGRKGGYGEKLRGETQAFWEHQKKMAAEIAALAKAEKVPVIIAGDFNVPNHGQIYHSYREQFTDAFEEAGSGYGLTFPGFTRNPLTFFGPWLRLDQIFCSEQLKPVSCRAEPGRRSQHRSMVAVFSKEE